MRLARLGKGQAAFEYKLDGARIQVHKAGDEVAGVLPSAETTSRRRCPR